MRPFLAAILLCGLIAGCGPSESDLSKPAPKRDGGFVRLLNLTGEPLTYSIDGQNADQSLANGSATPFRKIRSKSIPVMVTMGEVQGDHSIDVQPTEVYTVVITEQDGKFAFQNVTGEARLASDGSMINVVNLTSGEVHADAGGTDLGAVAPGSASKPAALSSSKTSVKIASGSSSATAEVETQPKFAYSVIVFGDSSKPKTLVLTNTVTMEASLTGASPMN